MFEYQRQRENFQSWQKQKITYKGIRIGLIIFFSQKNGCEETIKYSFKTIHEKVIKTRMWHMAKLLIKDLKTFNFILKINMRLLEQRSGLLLKVITVPISLCLIPHRLCLRASCHLAHMGVQRRNPEIINLGVYLD